ARLNTSIPLSEQEDLIVWTRTAALPTFRKLYGRIEVDLNEGDIINVTIQNQYNTYSFNGKKKLVLSTATWIGGKNDLIGILFLTVGGVCLFLSLFFTIGYFVKPRYKSPIALHHKTSFCFANFSVYLKSIYVFAGNLEIHLICLG
ncbi:variant 2, ALA-interacting subunit 3, partial [Lathyrus oleraceus]